MNGTELIQLYSAVYKTKTKAAAALEITDKTLRLWEQHGVPAHKVEWVKAKLKAKEPGRPGPTPQPVRYGTWRGANGQPIEYQRDLDAICVAQGKAWQYREKENGEPCAPHWALREFLKPKTRGQNQHFVVHARGGSKAVVMPGHATSEQLDEAYKRWQEGRAEWDREMQRMCAT